MYREIEAWDLSRGQRLITESDAPAFIKMLMISKYELEDAHMEWDLEEDYSLLLLGDKVYLTYYDGEEEYRTHLPNYKRK